MLQVGKLSILDIPTVLISDNIDSTRREQEAAARPASASGTPYHINCAFETIHTFLWDRKWTRAIRKVLAGAQESGDFSALADVLPIMRRTTCDIMPRTC